MLVTCANRYNISYAARCGGHSFEAVSLLQDGLVIDVSRISHIRISPDKRSVQIGAGQRLGEVNVLKPVPQPPLEPELDLNKASGTKLFWGRPCHVDAQHGPKQEAGLQGGGTAPLVGSGAKPQKPAMICTYYNQFDNGKCYSCTQLSTLHFVINLLEPACDMLARGWPRAGTRN